MMQMKLIIYVIYDGRESIERTLGLKYYTKDILQFVVALVKQAFVKPHARLM